MYIELKGNPPTRTAQQKGLTVRGGYAHFYEKKSVTQAKSALAWKLKKYVPSEPISGAISIMIEWDFELKKQKVPAWKTTRPDLDNLEKGLLDVMTDLGFWNDDAQIVIKHTLKKAVPVGDGCLRITIDELER